LHSGFVGKFDDRFPRPLIIKYSHKTDVPLQTLRDKLDNNKGTEQSLSLAQSGWCSIFEEGNNLNIEIYKESRRRKAVTLGRAPEGDLLCQVSIKFDDLWRHLVCESQKETKCELIFSSVASDGLTIPANFKEELIHTISGLQLWIVTKVCFSI